jgi:hypothetical protein
MGIHEDMKLIEAYLDDFDAVPRAAFELYRTYSPNVLIEHSSRTAASARYDHMVAEGDRRFLGRRGFVPLDIGGLKVWLVDGVAVVRWKKMDEDGKTRNYPTKQAKQYDRGAPLPGLPPPAIRLTVGYYLDATQTTYIRSQIARPIGKQIDWCAAIVPADVSIGQRANYQDVTRQSHF